jgi:hypothetical protein
MLQGQQTQQPQEVEPQPAPWSAPEEPQPAFTTDEGHVPLYKAIVGFAREGFTSGEDLIGNLKIRTQDKEADLKGKFVNLLLSHPSTRTAGVAAAAFFTPPEKFLTKDEYENSQYKRPGLNFDQGVYENLAQEESEVHDQNAMFQDLNARTDQGTWPMIAKGAAYLTGGIANPLFWEFGGLAGEALAPAATFLTDLLPEIKALSPEAQVGLKKFLGKTIIRGGEMPVFTGIDYAEERVHQEEASVKNILYSIPIGVIFGGLEFGAGKAYEHFWGEVKSSRQPELKSDFAKEKGMNEPRPDEPEPIVQPDLAMKGHEEALKSGVSQMENGKIPEVSEIVKQNYHDAWQERIGNKLVEDPEGYVKDIDDLKKSRDINQEKLDDVNDEIDQLTKEKVAPEDTRFKQLAEDKDTLLSKKTDLDDMIDTRENAPEASNMQDLAQKIAKQHSPQSDYSYIEPKPEIEIPPEEKSINDFAEKQRADFNARKANMDPKVKELADTEDIKAKEKGTQKFLNAVRACIIRGA